MNLYLASPYTHRLRTNDCAWWLTQKGHTIVSTWHTQSLESLDADILTDRYVHEAAQHAGMDLHEIAQCDALLCFTMPGQVGRGGVHFETGVAFALHKPVAIIGGASLLFHRLPGLTIYPTVIAWLAQHPAVKEPA